MFNIINSEKLSDKLPDKIIFPNNSYAFNPATLTDYNAILELSPNEILAAGCGNGNSGTGLPGERQVNSLQPDIDNYPNITQSETSLANFGEFILFGFNDSNDAPQRFSGYGFSSDSGATWSDCGSVPVGGNIVRNLGDPVIAVDSEGTFYYAHLGNTTTGEQVIILNTGQVNTTDRTFQFNNPIVVGTGVGEQDKEWITVGTDNKQPSSQALYITWSDFLPTGSQELTTIRFSKFTTGVNPTEIIGSKAIAHTTGNPLRSFVSGSFPVVDSSGNIYVFYEQIDLDTLNGFIYMVKSTDGGENFSPSPMLVSGPFVRAGNAVACGRLVIAVDSQRTIRINDFPHVAVAPDNTLYVVWNASVSEVDFESNIFLAYSTNNGGSWATVPITSTKTTEFFPSVAFNCGRAHIQYSRFNDPSNVGDTGDGTFALFKKSFFIPNDLSAESQVSTGFSPVPITNPNFDPAISNCYMGDYNQIVAGSGNTLYHAWGDNRNLINVLPTSTPIPNPDVFFIQTECVPAPTTPAPTTPAPTTPAPTTPAPTTPAPTTPAPTTPAPTTPAPTTPAPTTPAPTTPAPSTPAPTTPAPTTPAPTTPAPTTPAPTTPAPTPTPCPCCFATEAPVNFEKCQLTACEAITTTITCVGRFLDIDVILTNVCPNKFVDVGVLVFENDKLITFKVCKFFTDSTGDACISAVNVGKFCFAFEEPTACPPARTFTVRVVANYVEG